MPRRKGPAPKSVERHDHPETQSSPEERATFEFSPAFMEDLHALARDLGVPPTGVLQQALGLLKYAVEVRKNHGKIIAKTRGKLVELHV